MREFYISSGFCEYLTKPIDPVRLETMIVELLPDALVHTAITEDENGGADISELLDIYLDDIARMSAEIEKLYNNGDWTNYTIKVHALKSTSRLVGEQNIGALAEQLEKAGDSGDTAFIHAHNAELLEMYREVPEKYGRGAAADAKPDDNKPEATEAMMLDAFEDMRAAADNFDYDVLCEVLDELNDYRIPESFAGKMQAVTAAADSVDWGTLKQLLQ